MMWLLLPARRRLFVLLVFLFAMLALFPLRLAFNMLALQENGLAARAIHGSLWWGDIEQLTIGGVPLGNVEARLSPIQLFVGRARMDFSRQRGAPDDLKGAVSVNNSSFGVDDVTAHIGVGGLFAPLPVNGLDFDDLSVRFVDGACARDRLCSFKREGADKDGQSPQHRSLTVGKKIVAPVERGVQRLVSLRRGASSGPFEAEAAVQKGVDAVDAIGPDAARREFDRERDAVEATADAGHNRRVCVTQFESGTCGRDSFGKELDGREGLGRDGIEAEVGRRVFERGQHIGALAADPQVFATGREDVDLRRFTEDLLG